MQQLPHTYSLLSNRKPIIVGYFGGSITEGYGASDYERTSWRAELRLRVCPDHDPGSTGTKVRIGAFLINATLP
jgi:hypothetical protein